MSYSSIMGANVAPVHSSGRNSDALGPSDNSDSGSDAAGTFEAIADSDSVGTGERGSATPGGETPDGADILPDHVVAVSEEEEALATGEGFPDNDPDANEYTDLDADVDGDLDAEADS
jgi:hypothetical protein